MIKINMPYRYLKFKTLMLLALILSIQLPGCISKNEPGEVSHNISYSPTRVALLLPLESQNNNTNILANNLKNAAQLAAHDLKYLNLILTVYPTSGDPIRAAYAAKAAIAVGNQIIVGPLFSKETYAVKIALKNDTTKIISLSNDPSVAGKNVFVMGTTLQSVANRLVTFAQTEGLQRIAIVGPEGPIGASGIEAAKTAIISNNSTLTTVATYPLNVNDISEASPKIYTDLISSRTEAIIFTDSPTRGLGFITERISSLFKKTAAKQPQFMGLTRWDSTRPILDELSLNTGWFVIPDQRFQKRYAERYTETYGTTSSKISSLSYDAIALIGGIIKKSGPQTNARFFEDKNFTDNNGFIGVNGIFRFNSSGVSERSLSIAEVVSGEYKIIDKAKKYFMKNKN